MAHPEGMAELVHGDREEVVGAGVRLSGCRIGGGAVRGKILGRGFHQPRFDGVRTQTRIFLQHQSHGTRNDGRRHAGAAQPQILGGPRVGGTRVVRRINYIRWILRRQRRARSQ